MRAARVRAITGALLVAVLLLLNCVPALAYDDYERIYLDNDSITFTIGHFDADHVYIDDETGVYQFDSWKQFGDQAGSYGGYLYFDIDIPLSGSVRAKMARASSVKIAYRPLYNVNGGNTGIVLDNIAMASGYYADNYANMVLFTEYRNEKNVLIHQDLNTASAHMMTKNGTITTMGTWDYQGSVGNPAHRYGVLTRAVQNISTVQQQVDNMHFRSLLYCMTYSDSNLSRPTPVRSGLYIYPGSMLQGFEMVIQCIFPDGDSAIAAAISAGSSTDLTPVINAIEQGNTQILNQMGVSTVTITSSIEQLGSQVSEKLDSVSETLSAAINGDGYDEEKLSSALGDLSDQVNSLEAAEEDLQDFVSENLEAPTLEISGEQEQGVLWVVGQVSAIWNALEPVHILFYVFFFFFALSLLIFGRSK